MAKETKVQINKIGRTSSLGDEDVIVLEQKTNGKYITRSTTLGDLSDYMGTSGGGGGGGGGGKVKAADVSYDNAVSELDATNVQTAIDALAAKLGEFTGLGLSSTELTINSIVIEDIHPLPEE
ncbi:MAG: hypothetical protein J5725_04115 [Bacteroidales bacterium]|nr:hypothetical protein [Bacteroidales bacterium]